MSDVSLEIGGRNYIVACEAGQEEHLIRLGERIDAKLNQLGGRLSPQESQNLLFAGLFIADELHETEKSLSAERNAREEREQEIQVLEREAHSAIGKTGELNNKISDLETELDELQSTQQQRESAIADIERELAEKREQIDLAVDTESKLLEQVKELEITEADLQNQLDQAKSNEEHNAATILSQQERMAQLETQISDLQEQLDTALAAPVAPPGLTMPEEVGTELAPALERFAQLLENCADKLERPKITS